MSNAKEILKTSLILIIIHALIFGFCFGLFLIATYHQEIFPLVDMIYSIFFIVKIVLYGSIAVFGISLLLNISRKNKINIFYSAEGVLLAAAVLKLMDFVFNLYSV